MVLVSRDNPVSSSISTKHFERLFHEKGILAAFKEAGFHTVFISNQQPNHSFIDFLGEQADEHYFLKKDASSKENHYDADLLKKLDEILPLADASSSAHYHYRYRKLFVVLHSYGSHFNYQERYPSSFAYFKPDSRSEAKPENRRDLLNAYDNTIRYTDYILHGIIERLQKWEGVQAKTDGVYGQPTSAMLYTSDHGENIFDDDRRLFLHAAPKASDFELHVPFIIWTSDGFSKQYPNILKALGENRSKQVQSSLSAFHTMLSIGGIQTRYRQDEYSVASGKYHPTKLLYLDDHDEAIPQEDAKFLR
jgi:glucan phosphoethanolaminetransferase (alkaline phosphatase superfamily)